MEKAIKINNCYIVETNDIDEIEKAINKQAKAEKEIKDLLDSMDPIFRVDIKLTSKGLKLDYNFYEPVRVMFARYDMDEKEFMKQVCLLTDDYAEALQKKIKEMREGWKIRD